MSRAEHNVADPQDHEPIALFEEILEPRLPIILNPMLHLMLGRSAQHDQKPRLLSALLGNVSDKDLTSMGRDSSSPREPDIELDEDETINKVSEHLATNPSTRRQLEHLIASNMFRTPSLQSAVVKTVMEESAFRDTMRRLDTFIATGRSSWADTVILGLRTAWKFILCVSIFLFLLWGPRFEGLSPQAHNSMAIFAFTALLWITEALPLAISALIGCALCAILQVAEPKIVFAGFGSPVVLFLVGALMLGIAVKKVGLHKRVSHLLLSRMGQTPNQFLLGVGLLGCGMSMLIPVHCVVAMLVPAMIATITALPETPGRALFCTAVMLNLSYSASIGSLATLMGGGRNPLAIALYYEQFGQNISFFDWTFAALPVVITMFIVSQFFLRWYFKPGDGIDLSAGLRHMQREVERLGPFSGPELCVSAIVALAIVLWITVGLQWGLAVVAVISSSLLFVLKILRWRDIEKEFPWGILFMYGGAVSIAATVHSTGASSFMAEKVLALSGGSLWLFLLLATLSAIFLTEVISNAACLAILLPVLFSIVASTGDVDPSGAMFLVAFGTGLAFMLPISTPGNALVYASGYVSIRDMIKCGFWLNIAGAIILLTVGCLWWKIIGVL